MTGSWYLTKYYWEVMGFFFGLGQPQVCEWVKRLTPLLGAVLGREMLRPARRPADMAKLLADTPELLLLLDGTERPIRRPKDQDEQKTNYSGKKKGHCKKNLLVATGDKRAVYVGPTSPGSVHDKKLADESGLVLPPETLLLKDTGFQSYSRREAARLSSPRRSRVGANSTPSRRPSTKSLPRSVSAWNMPPPG